MMVAIVPENYCIRLERDVSSILRIRGDLYRGLLMSASGIRPWVLSDDAAGGLRNRSLESYFVCTEDSPAARRAFIDVSDMVSNIPGSGGTMMGFSLSYHSTMTQRVDSIIYLHSADGSESLTLNPTNVTSFAYAESISYATMQQGSFIYARARLSTMNETSSSPLAIKLNDLQPSKVPAETFAVLTQIITSHGSELRESMPGRLEIVLSNCYEQLIPVLPDLIFFLTSDRDSTSNGIKLIFRPNDYIRASTNSDICLLDVIAVRYGSALSLSDHLLRRIGGIHFDYTNGRKGFFDPLRTPRHHPTGTVISFAYSVTSTMAQCDCPRVL